MAVGVDQTAANAVQTTVTSRTATAVAGSATLPQNPAIAVSFTAIPKKKAAAGVTVMVEAICK